MSKDDNVDIENIESLKVMVIGDAAVGKTCMLISYSFNEFPKEYNPTVFDNYAANVVFKGKTIALGLWDTAGSEEYDTLRPISYPDTHAFVIVYSVISEESLKHVETKWVPEVKQHAPGVPYILVGNKSDLRNDPSFKGKLVSKDDADKVAKKVNAARYIECSAKSQHNLKEVFEECINVVYEAYTKKKGGKKKDCILS